MKRRALLAATTSLLALSGCASNSSTSSTPSASTSTTDAQDYTTSSPDSTDQTRTTDDPATTEEPRETQQLTIGETAAIGDGSATPFIATAQRSVFVFDGSHHYDIVMEPDAQYLVVSMRTKKPVDGNRAARASTALILDDERYPASDHYFPLPSTGGFKVGYRVPLSASPQDGRLVWTDEDGGAPIAEWTLSAETITGLNQPPAFDVVSFDGPDTVASFEPFDISITVENTGAGDGVFRAELGIGSRSDLSPYRVDVPVGERITATNEMQVSGRPGETETIILDWGLDRLERTVEIE